MTGRFYFRISRYATGIGPFAIVRIRGRLHFTVARCQMCRRIHWVWTRTRDGGLLSMHHRCYHRWAEAWLTSSGRDRTRYPFDCGACGVAL